MTFEELLISVNAKLTRNGSNRIDGEDMRLAVLEVIAYFSTQISNIIPLWTSALTFQTDGSDDGRFCRYADTNGKVRLFETKIDDNTNHAPPTNPSLTENTYWEEVSASTSAAIPEWAAGVYGPGLIIVFHNHSVGGRGLYVLLDPTRPYASTDIEDEIDAGDWEQISGGGGADFVYKEVPAGAINGSNLIFTLSETPETDSEHVFKNGVLESGYEISGNTITFAVAPEIGDDLKVSFQRTTEEESGGGGTTINHWRGDYAGTTTFPSTGGTHTAGVPGSGDMWRLTATLVVGGNVYGPGTVLLAAIDTPGQTLTNWIKLAAQS